MLTIASKDTEHMLIKVPSIVCGRENWYKACRLLRTAGIPCCRVSEEASLLLPKRSTADAEHCSDADAGLVHQGFLHSWVTGL